MFKNNPLKKHLIVSCFSRGNVQIMKPVQKWKGLILCAFSAVPIFYELDYLLKRHSEI